MSSVFRIESTSSIINIDGTDYVLDNFTTIQIEQARTNNVLLPMQRISNDAGVVYSENLGQGVTITSTIRNVPTALLNALYKAYDEQLPVGYSASDISAKNQMSLNNGYILNSPHSRTIGADESFSDVSLVIKAGDKEFSYTNIS